MTYKLVALGVLGIVGAFEVIKRPKVLLTEAILLTLAFVALYA